MSYPTYLVHFNKNHDSKNGQFTYGDGDGDGRTNDDKRVREKKISYLRKLKNAFMEGVNDGIEQQRIAEEQQRITREQTEQMVEEGRKFTREEMNALNYNQNVMNQQLIKNGNQFMQQMNYNAQLQNRMFFM